MILSKIFIILSILFLYENEKLEKDEEKLSEKKKKFINIGKIGKL
jgi:hypothetical protein